MHDSGSIGRAAQAAHPPGLFFVCTAELFERLAGCLLSSLLVLFLTERLGHDPARAIRSVGFLNAGGYIAALGGGALTGRKLPALHGGIGGGLLLAAGFAALAMDRSDTLPAAIALLVGGSGLFRPSIVLLLGQLYTRRDPQRDAGYTWFWTAINAGGVFALFAAGSLRTLAGWQAAFAAATLSMLLCVLILVAGYRLLRNADPLSWGLTD